MRRFRGWLMRLAGLFGRRCHDQDLDREIQSHLQMHIEDNVNSGMTLTEARRQALIKLGGTEATKELCREQRGVPWVETFVSDLVYATRMLRKNPGFTLCVVLLLALAIGANTAIFSVVNGVLLKPLPYPEPDQLVSVWETAPERGIEQERVSGPDYLDWRAQNSVFADLAVSPGWDSSDFKLVQREGIVRVHGTYASASLFTTFGRRPFLGRTLLPEEDRKEGNKVVVLGYELWQRLFNGNPAILGQTLVVENYGRRDYAIVGVMPPGFGQPSGCELWLPMGWMGASLDERRSAHWHFVVGRLKPGVTLAQARRQLNEIQARIKNANPEETIGSQVSIVPLVHQAVGRDFRKAMFVLWGVVAGILLIACANVANLMLARVASRQKEIALRLALGASRWRIMRQLLTESVLLGILGAAAGVLVGYWGLRIFLWVSPGHIPRLAGVSIDGQALMFTFGAAFLTAVIFGLAPAWQGTRRELNSALKEAGRAASAGISAQYTRNLLVVVEVALAIVLLVGAGLMVQSFTKLLATNRGFHPEQVLTADLDFSVSGFTTWVEPTTTRPQVHLKELLDHVRQLPGVESAGAAYRLLRPDNQPPNQSVAIFDQPFAPGEARPSVDANAITPDFLSALGIPLLRGRAFTEADTLHAPGVALVNESFVRRFFPKQDPLGKHITMVTSPGPLGSTDRFGVPLWCQIVGVVGDVKSLGMPPETVPEIYRSYWQFPMQTPTLVVRTTGDPALLARAIQRESRELIPNVPVPEIRPVSERVQTSIAQPRFEAGLMSLFGALALFLAACGIYAVLSYSVAQQRREIGVRIALGAQRTNILALIVGQGLKWTALGLAIGVGAALALTRSIQSLLYGVTATDPLTFLVVCLVLLAAALLACLVPAGRAVKVDPMVVLHTD